MQIRSMYKIISHIASNLKVLNIVAIAIVCMLIVIFSLWHRESTRHLLVQTAPADVPYHEHTPENTHYDHMTWAKGAAVVPEDLWITKISASVRGAPRAIFHNTYLSIENERDTWCPDNPRFIWSGSTVSTKHATIYDPPYGIFLKKGTVLDLEAAFHNGNDEGSGESFKAASLALDIQYELAPNSDRSKTLRFALIDASGCSRDRPIFTIPAGAKNAAFDTRSRPFVFDHDATILRAAAHFHGSYESSASNTLRLFLNDALIDEFTTQNITDDDARNPRLLQGQSPIPVGAGDTVWMEALFDNPSNVPVYEGMAIVGLYYSMR